METGCLASGNHFFPVFQILMAVKAFFAPSVNLFFQQILYLAGANYFVPILQIYFLLEAVFSSCGIIFQKNPLLRSVVTDFLFNGIDILSFIFSLKTLLRLGKPIFKKILSLLVKTVFYIFSDTDSTRSSLLVHLHRIFQLILRSGYWKRFLVLFKPLAFRAFFCWWTPFMK